MGYGIEEPIDFDERDINIHHPLSDFEKMLEYHEMTSEEYMECSNNQQRNLMWNWRTFGSE